MFTASSYDDLQIIRTSTKEQIAVKNRVFEANSQIGLRPTQEDRFVLVPHLFSEDISFCGVFDGTVGSDASEFISHNIARHLCDTPEIKDLSLVANGLDGKEPPALVATAEKIHSALRSSFLKADEALIKMCTDKGLHYTSSTGVAALFYKNLLTVAHIGDSKACIAKVRNNELFPEWLTVDHKPNMVHELSRIESCGGSLVWLHGNKPYIRGGDFFRRQAAGEHPKQLNYSRAFGGKDLKMYGLTADPDIHHFEITAEDKLVLIGSDGLWDVINPRIACEMALNARKAGKCATSEIVQKAIEMMPLCGVSDNVTVIAIFLE